MSSIINTSISMGSQKEDLAVVDVYKQSGARPINKAPVNNTETLSEAEQYRNDPSLANKLTSKIKGFIPKDVPSAIETIDRLSKITNDLKTPFSQLTPTVLNDLVSAFGIDANSPIASVLIGGVEYKNKKYKDASSFANFLTALTGNSDFMKVLDLQGESALFNVLLKQAIALGLPEAIDAIIEKITDEKLKKKLLVASLEDAARSSDLKAVNKIIDIIGVDAALKRTPTLITLILMFYNKPNVKVDINIEYNTLVNLLNRINVKWHKAIRNGVEIDSIEPFAYASRHAIELLITDPLYEVQAMIAGNYKSEHLMRLARKSYPRAGFFNY